MDWKPTGEGQLRCETHGEVFAQGRSCFACANAPVPEEGPGELGEFEQLTAEAQRRGLLSRLEVEGLLCSHAQVADARAQALCERSQKLLAQRGTKSIPLAVELANAGVKWFAEATKTWRGLKDMVFDRERRADAEKWERLHGKRMKPTKKRGGGVN